MSEAELYPKILLACSRGDTRLFRFNSGVAWQGRIVKQTRDMLILERPHPVKLAPEGFPDTAGLTSIILTPDMIGARVALFVGIEAKYGRNKPTTAQQSFINMVVAAGGRAGIAYSVQDAERIIRGEQNICS